MMAVCARPANAMVSLVSLIPLSSRMVTGIEAALADTLAIATPETYPDVLSKGTTNWPGLRVSKGTTASFIFEPEARLKTAKPVTLPSDWSCAQPERVGLSAGPVVFTTHCSPGAKVASKVEDFVGWHLGET